MDVLLFLTVALLLAGAIVAGIQKAWPMVLLCLGMCLWAISETGIINT